MNADYERSRPYNCPNNKDDEERGFGLKLTTLVFSPLYAYLLEESLGVSIVVGPGRVEVGSTSESEKKEMDKTTLTPPLSNGLWNRSCSFQTWISQTSLYHGKEEP